MKMRMKMKLLTREKNIDDDMCLTCKTGTKMKIREADLAQKKLSGSPHICRVSLGMAMTSIILDIISSSRRTYLLNCLAAALT